MKKFVNGDALKMSNFQNMDRITFHGRSIQDIAFILPYAGLATNFRLNSRTKPEDGLLISRNNLIYSLSNTILII
jgi:hypothetical protein